MPSSYRPPTRADQDKGRTSSQSTATNMKAENATVANITDRKGTDVFSIKPGDTLGHAVGVLAEKRIGALVVTDDTGALCGILSERDIVRKLAQTPGQTLPQLVGDVMTRNVKTCAPSDLLVTVLKGMTEGRFRHMPVVSDSKLVGMITIGDVINYRLTELEHEALQMKQLIVG